MSPKASPKKSANKGKRDRTISKKSLLWKPEDLVRYTARDERDNNRDFKRRLRKIIEKSKQVEMLHDMDDVKLFDLEKQKEFGQGIKRQLADKGCRDLLRQVIKEQWRLNYEKYYRDDKDRPQETVPVFRRN